VQGQAARTTSPSHIDPHHRPHKLPRGAVLDAIIRVLGDGRPRTTQELLHESIAHGYLPPSTILVQIDLALAAYIDRQVHAVRRPVFVRDPDRRIRANHPRDTWPDPAKPLRFRAPAPAALAALEVAQRTSVGRDPTAFERAVCDVFAALGFTATHIGGEVAPDGYIDAPLGPLGYRVVVECKTGPGRGSVALANVAEPVRYREAYGADFCALVGPAFRSERTLSAELHEHGISAWTTDDLAAVVHAALDPLTIRPLFGPGFAEDALADVLWERSHGLAKRVAVIAEMLQHVGLREQRLVKHPADAPRLTREAAMLCVNEALAGAGSDARCDPADVDAALAWMTSPLVRTAVWSDDSRTAIVVLPTGGPPRNESTHAAR